MSLGRSDRTGASRVSSGCDTSAAAMSRRSARHGRSATLRRGGARKAGIPIARAARRQGESSWPASQNRLAVRVDWPTLEQRHGTRNGNVQEGTNRRCQAAPIFQKKRLMKESRGCPRRGKTGDGARRATPRVRETATAQAAMVSAAPWETLAGTRCAIETASL
jgi:hypothetical protein